MSLRPLTLTVKMICDSQSPASSASWDSTRPRCFEDRFTIQLGHNLLSVEWKKGREHDPVTGRSDIWLTGNGRSIAIFVETKRPDHKLTDDDAWQGISTRGYSRKRHPSFADPYQRKNGIRGEMRISRPSCARWSYPTVSSWDEGGQQVPTIEDDLRFLAARALVVNPQLCAVLPERGERTRTYSRACERNARSTYQRCTWSAPT